MRGTPTVNRYAGLRLDEETKQAGNTAIRPITLQLSPGHRTVIDFSFLNDRPQMQEAFFRYFVLVGQELEAITKVGIYRAIQIFVRFLEDYEKNNVGRYRSTTDLDRPLLLNFKVWLQTRPLRRSPAVGSSGDFQSNQHSAASAAMTYNSFICFLNRLRRYRPDWLPLISGALPRAPTPQSCTRHDKDVLSMTDLKRIIKVAIADIEKVRRRHDEVKESLRRTEHLPIVSLKHARPQRYWRNKDNVVHTVIREQGVTGLVCNKVKQGLDRQGTHLTEFLNAYVPVGESALLPFALQLSIQTGLNITSLATLKRDCIEDFSLPQYKKLLYDKPRSRTSRFKSLLIPSYEHSSKDDGQNGPLELIRFLIEWTEPLIPDAPEELKNHLFLFRCGKGPVGDHRVKAVSKYEAFQYSLEILLKKHPGLPKFCVSDLRAAVATYVYLTTRDIYRVKRLLGHTCIKTTTSYVRGRILAAEHDLSIAEGIQRMISRLLPERASRSRTAKRRELPVLATIVERQPTTTERHDNRKSLSKSDAAAIEKSGVMTLVARCRRPYEPPAFLGVPAGHLCTRIFKCLSCPNATVLEEDLPTVLLRLKAIWAERERLSLEGWQILYAEPWAALNQVVRLFSNDARMRAEKTILAFNRAVLQQTNDSFN